MNSKKLALLGFVALYIGFGVSADSYARMPEPEFMPQELKGMEPHRPEVATYYLQKLVSEGKMTKEEARRTERYMIFRNERRMRDLQAVRGMNKEERRAYMKHKRELRGNPLKEYAEYCGFSYERARDLMNLMHGSQKGDKYYEEWKGTSSD